MILYIIYVHVLCACNNSEMQQSQFQIFILILSYGMRLCDIIVLS